MDRGAARSRKAASKLSKAETTDRPPVPRPDQGSARPNAEAGPSRRPPHQSAERSPNPRPKKVRPEDQSRDPSLYRAKAIRDSSALIYRQSAFPLPPPKDLLRGVRRVDLEGSNVTDLTWLQGTGVTWLSLAGCPVEQGWEAVGSLKELSVLNISNTGLRALPTELSQLSQLKALVAMNNPWTHLDGDVVASWPEMNSCIISHSPNLASLPSSLAQSYQLSKLTISHCSRLTASSLPDLSTLPLLRDVRMNNLPQLTTLPKHLVGWGTGDLSLAQSGRDTAGPRRGHGLESLDLGNCSLSFEGVSPLFGLQPTRPKASASAGAGAAPRWPRLRSLTLHSNPLAQTHPDYAESLQVSSDLPGLQIIDAKRVKERKRAGELPEFKADILARRRKEGKMKPTGANKGGEQMRQWGSGARQAGAGERDTEAARVESKMAAAMEVGTSEPEESGKKKRKRQDAVPKNATVSKRDVTTAPQSAEPEAEAAAKRKRKRAKQGGSEVDPPKSSASQAAVKTDLPTTARPSQKSQARAVPVLPTPSVAAQADPSVQKPSKPKKSETSVLKVIEVKKDAKGKKDSSGLDLKEWFATDENSGLGMGGW